MPNEPLADVATLRTQVRDKYCAVALDPLGATSTPVACSRPASCTTKAWSMICPIGRSNPSSPRITAACSLSPQPDRWMRPSADSESPGGPVGRVRPGELAEEE